MFSNLKLTFNCVQFVSRRYAGHSKWQNIKHTKATKDQQKSQLYLRLGQRIKIAIQESGSSDPLCNVKLQQAINTAKSKHMPSATIQSYVNQGKKGGDNLKTIFFDLRGPKGIFFIVQAITDTPVKVKNNLSTIAKKSSLTIETNLRNQFNHKGVVVAKPNREFQNIQELSVEHAIESGAEDVYHDEEENSYKFICDSRLILQVSDKLKEIGYEIEEADEHYFPIFPVTIDDAYLENLEKVVEKINNIPGVVKVYDNIA